jgi:GT2 family glycosyltransferase
VAEPSSKPARLVHVVVVSYKTAELVTNLLHSLCTDNAKESERGVILRVLVVDNDSGDAESLQKLVADSGWQDWVTILKAPKNGGFAYGNNLGFRHGFESAAKPDYFFLLNPDTEVRPGAVSALIDFLEQHPGAGIAASSCEDKNGVLWPYAFRYPGVASELDHALRLRIVSKLLIDHAVLKPMGQSPEQVDWFPGAAMMVRRQVIEDVGGMDEQYFLYYEETDFCRKVKQAGWSLWYVPQSRIMHIAGESTGVTGEKSRRRRLPAYWFESRRRYFVKNHGLAYATVADVLFLASHLLGQTKEVLKGRGDESIPNFWADFFRHSVLHKANRSLSPAQEFKPTQTARVP